MQNKQIALKYLECFCAGDVDGIADFYTSDLNFSGTLMQFDNAQDYFRVLKNDPPVPAKYRLVCLIGEGDEIAMFYDYIKPEDTVRIAQLLKFRNGKICEDHVIFDASGFSIQKE